MYMRIKDENALAILTPTVRTWFATERNGAARTQLERDKRRAESLVQEGSRLQLRRLGVAGTKGHP